MAGYRALQNLLSNKQLPLEKRVDEAIKICKKKADKAYHKEISRRNARSMSS